MTNSSLRQELLQETKDEHAKSSVPLPRSNQGMLERESTQNFLSAVPFCEDNLVMVRTSSFLKTVFSR